MNAADIASLRTAIDKNDKSAMKKWSKDLTRRYNASFGPDGVRMNALADILKNPSM